MCSKTTPHVDYRVLNLESFLSIRNFSHEINREPRLDMLINNGGGLDLPDVHTEDGLTLMMQVHFFGPFLLTYLLLPPLKSSAPSRVINGSAVFMDFGTIDFDHWNDLGRYSLVTASANAKLAKALVGPEWHRRLQGTGVSVNSYDPFFIISRYLNKEIRNSPKWFLEIFDLPRKDVGQEVAYYASAPELKSFSGVHYKFCAKWPHHRLVGNLALMKQLWRETKKMVKIKPEED